jgi:hypothetical protein
VPSILSELALPKASLLIILYLAGIFLVGMLVDNEVNLPPHGTESGSRSLPIDRCVSFARIAHLIGMRPCPYTASSKSSDG